MTKKTKQRITAWSPSRLYDYEACPRKAKYKIIDRLPDPGSAAMERGNHIHELLEQYVAKRSSRIPAEAMKVREVAKKYRNLYALGRVRVECQLAFDKNWRPTGYFSDDAWLRLKVDVLHIDEKNEHAHVLDWKTGRFKPDDAGYADQLNLYAIAALSAAHGKTSSASLVFTDHGEVVEREEGKLNMEVLRQHQKRWEGRVKFMLLDTHFEPHPGNACRWCPFSKNKGGPCDY